MSSATTRRRKVRPGGLRRVLVLGCFDVAIARVGDRAGRGRARVIGVRADEAMLDACRENLLTVGVGVGNDQVQPYHVRLTL